MALATFGGLQFLPGGEQAFGSSLSSSVSRGSITFGQKAFLNPTAQSGPSGSFNARALGANRQSALAVSAQALDLEQRSIARGQRYTVPNALPVWPVFEASLAYGLESSVMSPLKPNHALVIRK